MAAGDDLDAALLRRERTDVPDTQHVVHGVGEDVGAIGEEGDAGDGVVGGCSVDVVAAAVGRAEVQVQDGARMRRVDDVGPEDGLGLRADAADGEPDCPRAALHDALVGGEGVKAARDDRGREVAAFERGIDDAGGKGGAVEAALVDELEDVVEVPGGDASEIEHDGHEGGAGGEDDLVSPQRLDGSVGGVSGKGDIEKPLVVADVGEEVAHAALKVFPGDVAPMAAVFGRARSESKVWAWQRVYARVKMFAISSASRGIVEFVKSMSQRSGCGQMMPNDPEACSNVGVTIVEAADPR